MKLEQFGGSLPLWEPHLIPPGQAAYSENGYLFSGALTGWRQPKLLRQLQNSAAKFVYRVPTITETAAAAYLGFKTQPNADDTVSLGEFTYRFVSKLSQAFDVLIGASTLATATNLLNALTLDNGNQTNMGVTYGTGTTQNTYINVPASGSEPVPNLPLPAVGTATVSAINLSYVYTPSPNFGAAYNTTAVSESTGGARTIWLSDLLSIADTTTTFTGGTNPTFDNSITGDATWLEFLDPDTDVLRSQVVDDAYNRYYYFSPSKPPEYNTGSRIAAGKTQFLLGVPPPGCAPTVTVTGGGDNLPLGPQTATANGNQIFIGNNSVYLYPIIPSGASQLQDVQFLPQDTDTTVQFAAVCFADASESGVTPTHPGNLINTGSVVTGVTAGTNSVSQFVNPSNLLASTVYWIGIMVGNSTNAGGIYVSQGDTANISAWFSNTFSNGPPGVAPGSNTQQADAVMWADLITSDVIEARAYLYTWISAYGEEGPPSPPTIVNGWSNGTWTVGLFQPPAADLGTDRNLAVLRLYRTVSAVGGATTYFWVADISLASSDPDAQALYTSQPYVGPTFTNGVQSTMGTGINAATEYYTDTNPDSLVATNLQMGSSLYFPPPENLEGAISLPNGMVAAFSGNQIWYAQPYLPHAWPPSYVQTTDFPVVGLGITAGALVVCTNAKPYVITGISPSQLSMQQCSAPNPCNTKRSIVSLDAGVYYSSPNGLIQVTNTGQASNTTELWIGRDQWQQLTPQDYVRAVYLVSFYFAFGTVSPPSVSPVDTSEAQTGFNIELDADSSSFTIWPQPGGHRIGFNLMSAPNGFDLDNVLIDPWTGICLLVQNGAVYQYDFTDATPTMIPYDYKSKIYQQNTKKCFEVFKVFFSVPAGTPTPQGPRLEAPPGDPRWASLGPTQYLIVKVYADVGDPSKDNTPQLICCREVRKSGELLRLPSGMKYENIQFELIGRVAVSNLQAATSAKELKNV